MNDYLWGIVQDEKQWMSARMRAARQLCDRLNNNRGNNPVKSHDDRQLLENIYNGAAV